ncbi:5'-methylthioadenosine/S-adenosylhomocysteine nucleosidase [Streptomyces sp. NPDC049906]|uniref:5'-methylthioadenosine/S-adenosylhomocysteine nucleosidase family protein n=1 Tax=Streptomyces sp. NPDC049906 TaxID=3155656 RepID=UPI00342B623A
MGSSGGKIVVFTALPLEYQAVRQRLECLQRIDHEAGTIFECGRIPGISRDVYIAQVGQGNLSSALATDRAIGMIGPEAVFFTGIAGGLKHDIAIGDVVVATRVFAYHGGKQEGTFRARPETWQASHRLEQTARYVALDIAWEGKRPFAGHRPPEVHFKPIAAGEVVVNASESTLHDLLNEHYNGVVAIETEGAGFASAASMADRVPSLVIRGISDLSDGTKQHTDARGFQPIAADNAAAMTIAVIKALVPSGAPKKARLVGQATSVTDLSSVAAPVCEHLEESLSVTWRRKLLPPGFSEGATLEVHLVPEHDLRLSVRQMSHLKKVLVSLGSKEEVFEAAKVSKAFESDYAAAFAHDRRRGGSTGLAILQTGQRSCWEPLPYPSQLHVPVLDPEYTQVRVANMLRILLRLHEVPQVRYAPALAIDPAETLTVANLGTALISNSATLARRWKGGPAQILPRDLRDVKSIEAAIPEIAEDLTSTLVKLFKSGSGGQRFGCEK